MSLMEQIEAALESVPPKSGITVLGPAPDHRLLASRDTLRGHGHVFVFLAVSGDIRGSQTNSGSERGNMPDTDGEWQAASGRAAQRPAVDRYERRRAFAAENSSSLNAPSRWSLARFAISSETMDPASGGASFGGSSTFGKIRSKAS